MTISKKELEARFPGTWISGELNPDIPESQWTFTAGLAQQIIDTANSKVKKSPDLFVYLLQQDDTNLFKVGITTNVQQRLKTIQQNNPNKLNLVTYSKNKNAEIIEQQILQQLAQFSVRGEWVECSKSIVLKTFNSTVKRYQESDSGS